MPWLFCWKVSIKFCLMKQKKDFPVFVDAEARQKLNEILGSLQDDGNSVHYPAHIGTVGYFPDKSGNGEPLFTAFDNLSGDCWVENFQTRDGAKKWCLGEMSAEDVRKMESNVDTIILSKDSFLALKEPGASMVADMPPYLKFDENGEMEIKMQFFDGYAFDTNPHGLGMYDRLALYYPTIDEVLLDEEKQKAVKAHTGRDWLSAVGREKIYDIALTFGKASRLHCPTERYDAAVTAVVERASDRRARAFTPDQRDKIELAAASNGEKLYNDVAFRQTFYDGLFDSAKPKLKDINPAWAEDAHKELRELNEGKIREGGRSLHR